MATLIIASLLFFWSLFLSFIAQTIIDDHLRSLPDICQEQPSTSRLFWPLSPWFELASTGLLYLLFQTSDPSYLPSYFILFSALIITIKTDLQTFMISQFASLFLVPLGIMLSFFGLLPISPLESALSALVCYLFFYCIATLFLRATGTHGLGEGDWELIALIGSFVGIFGSWVTITIGSTLGALCGGLYLLRCKSKERLIPFGPFLAIGAMSFVLLRTKLIALLSF